MRNNNNSKNIHFLGAVAALLWLGACSTPSNTTVGSAELPDYRVENFRIDDPVDLYIEPQIKGLAQTVKPRSPDRVFDPIEVDVGAALEQALIGVTRQHFSRITEVKAPDSQPTLSYTLLTFRPTVTVDPRLVTTALAVSARIAIEMKLSSAAGTELFTSTIIGTSHTSDKNIGPGKGLGDAARLLEIATREAIVDAMYDVSRQLGSNSDYLAASVRSGGEEPAAVVESIDETILHVQTRRDDDE